MVNFSAERRVHLSVARAKLNGKDKRARRQKEEEKVIGYILQQAARQRLLGASSIFNTQQEREALSFCNQEAKQQATSFMHTSSIRRESKSRAWCAPHLSQDKRKTAIAKIIQLLCAAQPSHAKTQSGKSPPGVDLCRRW